MTASRAATLELDLAELGMAPLTELRRRWTALTASDLSKAPAGILRRLIAQRVQENRHRGLPSAVVRELERSNGEVSSASRRIPLRSSDIRKGTRFVREWRGQTVSVVAVDGGFEWDGQRYDTLSQIACKVTGAHWSGPRFFGLNRKATSRG